MNGEGTVEGIFTAPDANVEMNERDSVEAVAGRGLRGDRYFSDIETGTFVNWGADEDRQDGYDLTLIEGKLSRRSNARQRSTSRPANTGGTS